jgi:hypothetical protein
VVIIPAAPIGVAAVPAAGNPIVPAVGPMGDIIMGVTAASEQPTSKTHNSNRKPFRFGI